MSESVSPSPAADGLSGIGSDAAVLSGNLGIRDVESIRDRLMQQVSHGGPVRVDVGGLTGLDTSIVQLLIAAKRSADLCGCAIDIRGVAQSPLPDVMTALGLTLDELGNGSHASGRHDAENRDAEPVIAPDHGDADVTGGLRSMTAAPIKQENPPLTHEVEDQR